MNKNYFVTKSFIVEHPIIFLEIVGVVTCGCVAMSKILSNNIKKILKNGNVITIHITNSGEFEGD